MTDLFEPVANQGDPSGVSSFEQLVGDGKKFQDQEALAKGKLESDRFIAQLQAELKTARDEIQKRLTVEELAAKIESARMEEQSYNQNSQQQSHPQGETISKDEIFNLVKQTINQERTVDQARRNVEYVRTELKNEWGPDFHVKLQNIAKELDISQEFLGSLAETNPQGFLKVVRQSAPIKQGDPNQFVAPRTSSAPVGGPLPNSWNYYQDMKQKDPRRYWSIPVQAEIHRQAINSYNSGKEYIPV